MIINTNIPAINTLRKMNTNQKSITTNLEKLSSGSRINKAADDAAGLAISEKMRAQIRGLEQANRNIKDGISLVQVADSTMAEIQNLLQRVRELAVQAANDTNTDDDRKKIQSEIDQILSGINEIANQTQFNKISLLNGAYDKDGNLKNIESITNYVHNLTQTGGITDGYTINGKDYASAFVDFSNIQNADDAAHIIGKGIHFTCGTCDRAFSIKFVDYEPDNSNMEDYNRILEVDIRGLSNSTEIVNKVIETAYGEPFVYDPENNILPPNATRFVDHFSQLAADGSILRIYDNRDYMYSGREQFPTADRRGVFEPIVYQEPTEEDLFQKLILQTGGNQGQQLLIEIPNVTIQQLGIEKVSVNTQINANNAISQIDQAINKVSTARGVLGSYQNRLEHAYNYLSNSLENITSSESRIRDADVAKEMSNLRKQQILLQSSQAMLAESSQLTQGVLNFLR